ncbi:hypothetical protein HanXRQr2_Chr11g0500031 [Helianthus annuus]|uniref:Uncharacterized protein n=1 Tax=Helianthus annuus TaxID=4232 RepID=A0A9K3HQP2_HELAN|nr:hypothetical protein HanXRQr2_Chr11g0500031 [Helianthus annuus]KAJ0875876.1 hypothetical protein HanPSC8_Chr11g0481741 [Helianthus annuus]
MKSSKQCFINGFFRIVSNESETSRPLCVVIIHHHHVGYCSELVKIGLEIVFGDRGCQTTNKDLFCANGTR